MLEISARLYGAAGYIIGSLLQLRVLRGTSAKQRIDGFVSGGEAMMDDYLFPRISQWMFEICEGDDVLFRGFHI